MVTFNKTQRHKKHCMQCLLTYTTIEIIEQFRPTKFVRHYVATATSFIQVYYTILVLVTFYGLL
jgi:hypothetical protein